MVLQRVCLHVCMFIHLHTSIFGHFARMDDDADAEMILMAPHQRTGRDHQGVPVSYDPTNSVKALKEVVFLRIGFNPTRSTSRCYKPKQS